MANMSHPDPLLKVTAAPVWKEQEVDDLELEERMLKTTSKPVSASEIVKRPSSAKMFGFKDPEEIKEKVRNALLKPDPYNVCNYYKKSGLAQEIARHSLFENVTLAVIALNAVYIAIDTDWNKDEPLTPTDTKSLKDSHWFFQLMEHLFCVYFTFEICVRYSAFARKRNGLKDYWFVFDSCLVTLMVMETWVIEIVAFLAGWDGDSPLGNASILRLLRLLRLSRLIRMLRSLPELMILVKGMVSAMSSVFYVMCLLLIVTYVFAICFTILAVDTESIGEIFFKNIALSMYTLLIYLTYLDNLSVILEALRMEMWQLLPLALVFLCLAALTLMNMLIGVLCEVVSAVAETEKQEMITLSVTEQMINVARRLDTDYNDMISYEEFTKIVEDPEALRCLSDVGVCPVGVAGFAELFFFSEDGGEHIELTFDRFMEMVLDLREENMAAVKDIKRLWLQLKLRLNDRVQDMRAQLQQIEDRLDEWTQIIEGKLDIVVTELRLLAPGESARAA
jgi:hypothetical protein